MSSVLEECDCCPVSHVKEVVPKRLVADRAHQWRTDDAMPKPSRRVHVVGDEGKVV